MQQIIDPHIHLFNLRDGDYHWLKPKNPPFWQDKHVINNSFNEANLHLKPPLKLAGFVHIEAGFDNQDSYRELTWLQSHCKNNLRTVAFVDLSLTNSEFKKALNKLKKFKTCVGIRHIFDNDADKLLSSTTCLENLAQLAEYNLLFELQMSLTATKEVNLLNEFIKKNPKLKLVINHAGWPNKAEKLAPDWTKNIATLAKHSNLAIKCSGWEMANSEDRLYSTNWQWQVIKQCLDHFGDHRVMLASNFPLVLFAKSYQQYWQDTLDLLTTQQLGSAIINRLCADNARYWYNFTA